MKSCPKCRKSGPGTRTSRKWLDLAGQGLVRTKTAAAIHGSSPREGQERRQMVYWELVWDCNSSTRAHEPSPRTWDTCARSDTSARHASDPHIMRNVNRAPRREPGRSDLLSHAVPTAHQPHAKGMAPKHPGRRTPRRSPCPHSRPAQPLYSYTNYDVPPP